MRDRKVGSVLVTHNGALVGIFTGRDAVGRVLALDRSASETTLEDVMTKNPVTLPPDRSAVDVIRLMQDRGFRHVPVIDGDKILGVVSKGEVRSPEYERIEGETIVWKLS